MLELKNIVKIYDAASEKVEALKGVSIKFRKSEFVSILGPSGCGKTTLLNIIGGLDKYTSGDLIIDNVSTKNYKDRDWDSYRNYKVGFVFQTYNLIPHQSVLANVELALSLSGVSKKESKRRAIEALEKVGLKDQIRKRPNELSGGQMQRVAIARAIVNDPDIILADEPTGALDSKTSVQVMDILKELSKDRLVVMVTHNKELAEKYSTRIITALDGLITSDSNPYEVESKIDNKKRKKAKKPSLSFGRSFSLSLKNLFTKKGRTTLTAFAGSIGIIGIALIYAVSNGTTQYINMVQEDTLASYPLTLEEQHLDMSSLINTFLGKAKSEKEHKKDAVYQKTMMYDLINALNNAETDNNDLKAFKSWLEKERQDENSELELEKVISGVQYTYNFDPLIYTENIDGKIVQSDSSELMQEVILENMGMDLSTWMDYRDNSVYGSSFMGGGALSDSSQTWQELLSSEDELIAPLVKKQYDLIYGQWPQKYNEVVLVVDENNELSDLTLYSLGLKSKEEISKMSKAAIDGKEIKYKKAKYSYKDICDREFRTILNSECYSYDSEEKIYRDTRDTTAGLKYLYDNGVDLKVTGIIRENSDTVQGMIKGSICYTKDLTKYIIKHNKKSDAIKAQLDDKNLDIFTNLPFKDKDGKLSKTKKQKDFKEYIDSLDTEGKASTYIKIKSIPSVDDVEKIKEDTLEEYSIDDIRDKMKESLKEQTSVDEEKLSSYIDDMNDDDLKEIFLDMVEEQYKAQYAQGVEAQMMNLPSEQLSVMLDNEIDSYSKSDCARYYDDVLEFSDSTYDDNLKKLGYVDINKPSTINLYASSFNDKEKIEDGIKAYNDTVDDLEEIKYTDYIGILMSSITTIIDAITYVLIAFVAVSLIVSSIMIGVITLISVQERTKEIGILRSIGASKRNVSTLFNAETIIIGFLAGVIGVGVTYLLTIPINLVLHELTGIYTLSASLPILVAGILVAISVLLTLIAGIIPSRSASKKDPVVALRTE